MVAGFELKGEIMAELSREKCEACHAGAPAVADSEVAELGPQVPEWKLLDESERKLQRVFRFKNFADAMAFTVRVGELAEFESHHPAILTEWGRVTITWWTHANRGLHRNDFIMAAKTDAIFAAKAL
jgi:4a-hydroxytetrahydrobiopterin dehydratase